MQENRKQSTLKYLLSDIHGVLTTGDERKRFILYMERRYKIDYAKHNLLWNAHLKNLDLGKERPSFFIKTINRAFHSNFSVKTYYQLFLNKIRRNDALLRKLSTIKNYKVIIVSDNFSSITAGLGRILGKAFESYPKFYSYSTHVRKAEGLLDTVLKLLRAKPEDCFFVDDNERYVRLARKIGMNALLFRSNKELFLELKRGGIS